MFRAFAGAPGRHILRVVSLIFIGTPEFAAPSLRRLVSEGHDIAAVVTQPDRPAGRGRALQPPPVKAAALDLGLPVLQPATLHDPETLGRLQALAPQAMVAVAYGQILRPEVLAIPPKGVVNVHPSLLPRWRGASPIAGAILAGDAETGVTIMLMDAGMDTGPILSQRRHPISPQDTTGSLTQSLAEAGADLLVDTLPRWLNGEIEGVQQDDSQATTTRLIRKEDGALDWTLAAAELWRRVQAYNPWPGAFSTLGGEQVRFWQAWPVEYASGEAPGTVIAAPSGAPADARFAVMGGDGALAVIEAQRAGRKRLTSAEFLRGMPGLIGRRLG
jgi:methionyl-tRNA formyltransferase